MDVHRHGAAGRTESDRRGRPGLRELLRLRQARRRESGRLSTGDVTDRAWLAAWGEMRYQGRTAPFELPHGVLILHPFTMPDGEPWSWRTVAELTGALDDLREGPGLDPRELWPTERQVSWPPLNLPTEGFVPADVRHALAEVLGPTLDQPLTVGLYGGWGRPQGIDTDPQSVEVSGLEYWLAHVDGTAFFRAWSEADDLTDAPQPWDDLVAFVWPADRRWFVVADPDNGYSEVYGDPGLIERLAATSLETVVLGRVR